MCKWPLLVRNSQVPTEICEVNRQKAICITAGITLFNPSAYVSGKPMRAQPISSVVSGKVQTVHF